MIDKLKNNQRQIWLIFTVFSVFLAHALGVFNLFIDINAGHTGAGFFQGPGEGPWAGAISLLASPEVLLMTVTGVVLSIALPVLNPVFASVLTFVVMLPVLFLGYQVPAAPRVVPMEYALLTILVLFVVNVLLSYFTETRRKQHLLNAFGTYLPPQLVQVINRDPSRFSLEGEARELTIMFADIYDFTQISENLSPRDLTRFLNTVFTPLTEVIYKHKGTVDKYMGDAIMSFWGAPVDDPRHATNALAAALEMQEALARLRPEFAKRGWPEVHMGIGLNTGTVSVGNMGSKYRMAYTVIGDAVNLAARYQALTRVYKTGIIVGATTRKASHVGQFRELGLVAVKGKRKPARIFEPVNPGADPESTLVENMRRHNEALRSYYARDWTRAKTLFEILRDSRREDPIYPYYLERITEYQRQAPPDGWCGEIRFTVK